jgi:PhzF family phenazine biosynthesis protein
MTLPIVQVDAFTSEAFGGNPAAVCVMPEARDAEWMQNVAREMNLAETAFLRRNGDGFDLRWFAPGGEVDLCGHATLASAHVLWETGELAPGETARFHTKSGLLTAVKRGEWIELDFPATPAAPAEAPPGLVESLGVAPRYVGKSRFDYLVEVESEDALRRISPDFGKLRRIPTRGVIVTSRSGGGPKAAPSNTTGSAGFDFVSRFFAPALGVDEDPVTGSTHCTLAPFWGERLHKNAFLARQLSARGGVLKIEWDKGRVRLSGQAVTVLRGQLLV